MISDKRTSGLLGQLGNIKNDEEFEKYISENTFNNYSDDKNNALTFSAYYNSILAEKSIPLKNAIKESNLPDYAYQIVNGTRSNPGREKIICLCIAAHMNITETKRALEIAQAGILYPKNIRDAIIIKHINTDDFSVMNINCDLDKHGLPCLNDIK